MIWGGGPPLICVNTDCRAPFRSSAVIGTTLKTGGTNQRMCPRCVRRAKVLKKAKRNQEQDSKTLD